MRYLKQLITLLTLSALLAPALALAQSASAVANTSTSVATPSATVQAGASAGITAKMQTAISRADQEIERRISALSDLDTRVAAMQKVTASFKQTISTNIQNEVTALGQLKAKIDADTDEATLKTDVQSVTKSYRVYALILPQSRIAVAADREVTIIGMMSTLGSKLQALIAAKQSAGQDVGTLLAALTDMSGKLEDANTQAQASVSVTASLTPDNGDATAMAQNTTALKTGRSDIATAQQDLAAARKDITTITTGLKSLGAAGASTPASASSTTAP